MSSTPYLYETRKTANYLAVLKNLPNFAANYWYASVSLAAARR